MTDRDDLKAFSTDVLSQELKARQRAKANRGVSNAPSSSTNQNLAQFDDETLAKAALGRQKVIYGADDRIDVFQMTPGRDFDDVDSVVALFNARDITDNGDGTSTLSTQNFGTSQNLCAGQAFAGQPVGAHCSGFLVAADLVATAGHCVNVGNVTDKRFVFGFRMRDATTAETVINNNEIYSGAAVVDRQEVANGPDWAVIRLDRAVTNHRIAEIRRTGRIGDGQAVHVIGHPVGLPTKFAGGANVRDNTPAAFFVANLDTYGGNSGLPVFNATTHQVEGILVRGETDFVMQGNCNISLVCPNTGCRGEDVTRTTEFDRLVPVPLGSWVARHGLTNAQYQQAFDEFVGQGFRLVHVDGYGVNGQDLYAAIWAVDGAGRRRRRPDWAMQYQLALTSSSARLSPLARQRLRAERLRLLRRHRGPGRRPGVQLVDLDRGEQLAARIVFHWFSVPRRSRRARCVRRRTTAAATGARRRTSTRHCGTRTAASARSTLALDALSSCHAQYEQAFTHSLLAGSPLCMSNVNHRR